MTPNEITTVIASSMDKTFDLPFKLMIMERVDVWRSRLIKNSLDKTPTDRKFFKSTIYLNTVQTSDIPCNLPIPSCDIYMTEKVVRPLRANSILFDYVGGINGLNPFAESSAGNIYYRNKGKYSKGIVPFLYSNERIYILEKVPMIRIDFIADNPTDLQDYQCIPGETTVCDYWNEPYPCSNDILQMIIQFLREVDFRVDPQIREVSAPVNPINELTT